MEGVFTFVFEFFVIFYGCEVVSFPLTLACINLSNVKLLGDLNSFICVFKTHAYLV